MRNTLRNSYRAAPRADGQRLTLHLNEFMFYTERAAFVQMSAGRQAFHLVVRWLYYRLGAPRLIRPLWRFYRWTWPG